MNRSLLFKIIMLSALVLAGSAFIVITVIQNPEKPAPAASSPMYCGTPELPEAIKAAKELYNVECRGCHAPINTKDVMILNVYQRMDEELFEAFIRNEDSLIALKDEYVLQMNREWDGNYSHSFNLNQEEIKLLWKYINPALEDN